MDVFDSPEKVVLFLLLFLPGFISMKVYEMFTPWGKIDFTKKWMEAVVYSSLNFIALSWFIVFVQTCTCLSKTLYFIDLILIGVIFPALWGYLYFRLSRTETFAKYIKSPYPTSWDYFFNKKEYCWVILHLKNGEKIGGKFYEKSYASAHPDKEQIYLEEVWELDKDTDEFIGPFIGTKGMLISNDEISYIEFFE
jgi:hypothetical protein